MGEFCQTFKEESFLNSFKKKKKNRRGNTSKLILSGQHHPDTKARQRHLQKYHSPNEYRCKNPQQITSKLKQQHIKESYAITK